MDASARDDLATIAPFLPVIMRSSSLFWPPGVLESFKAFSLGPDVSGVDSGEVLFDAILDLRDALGLSSERLAYRASHGYALFFDKLMSREDARRWFGDVIPTLAKLLLHLPSMLENHYKIADAVPQGRSTTLRVLHSQEAGMVLLCQELIASLLACSIFCLFPTSERGVNHLPTINFDNLFAGLCINRKPSQEHKIKCLVHYYERISSSIPCGFVSFERKVLPLEHSSSYISYPEAVFWEKSVVPLCSFEVSDLGLIEDKKCEVLEVDFANEYLGGGALHGGCVQEEIRFMINPELIVGMLFLPSMKHNEAIEIVGAERFSDYKGYASSFQFVGDHFDKTPVDYLGRRKTRIVAIDALQYPGMRQYGLECLIRETNKAFCGFFHQSQKQRLLKLLKESEAVGYELIQPEAPVYSETEDNVGIATGNWGCGAFGGDPQLKSMLQWIAASQALRPFILYYTFGDKALQRLEEIATWIVLHEWTVGDLWSMLSEYGSQRLKRETTAGLFDWMLPLPPCNDSTAVPEQMSE